MTGSILRRAAASLAALAVIGSLSACSPFSEPSRSPMSTTAEKNGDGRLRTDLEPLTSRFAALDQPVSAAWMSGELGSGRVPGPTSYWIDAVVTVTPATAARLRELATEDAAAVEVVEELASHVPQGALRTSDALDVEFSQDGWHTRAWLVDGADVVVLASKGQ